MLFRSLGEAGTDGDGRIVVIENGRPQPFATGLDDPRGLVFFKDGLFVVDRKRIVRIDAKGTVADFQTPGNFPREPVCLHDIAVDPQHEVFVASDSGGGRVFRVPLKGGIETIADATTIPGLRTPAGLAFDGHACVLVADRGTGDIHRVKLADRSARRIAAGLNGVDGLVWDHHGRLFATSATTGAVFGIPQPAARAVQLAERLQSAGDGCLRRDAAALLVPQTAAGMVVSLPTAIPGREIDERPLDVQLQPAFPKLKWTGWDDGSDTGVATTLRPIVLTHFGEIGRAHV